MPGCLPERVADEMRDMIQGGDSPTRIARKLSVSKSVVTRTRREMAIVAGAVCDCGKPIDHPGSCAPGSRDDHEACVKLWGAVIAQAVSDYRLMSHYASTPPAGRQERINFRRARDEYEPAAFFESDWFDQICHICGASPESVRAGIGL